MTEEEREDALLEGFDFALHVICAAHNITIPGTESEKRWELLREIADGRETIVTSAADWARRHPHMRESVHERLPDAVNARVRSQREAAQRILAAHVRQMRRIAGGSDE